MQARAPKIVLSFAALLLIRESGRSLRAHQPVSPERGAWYPDPFELAAERWWDGGRWTETVRDPLPGVTEVVPTPAPVSAEIAGLVAEPSDESAGGPRLVSEPAVISPPGSLRPRAAGARRCRSCRGRGVGCRACHGTGRMPRTYHLAVALALASLITAGSGVLVLLSVVGHVY